MSFQNDDISITIRWLNWIWYHDVIIASFGDVINDEPQNVLLYKKHICRQKLLSENIQKECNC
jgi:hypothetical protein